MVKEIQIDVESKQLALIKKILKRHIAYKSVWAYGSRVNWTANQHSDLDLVVFEVSTVKLGELKEDFVESDLPFSVDIILWEKIPETFKNKILEKYVILQEKPELVDWNEGVLRDIAEVTMGQSPKGESCNTNGNGAPLLNGPTEFGVKNPHPLQFTEDPKKLCKKNDILFCVRGSTTGRMNWADQQYAIGRGIAAIRHKEGDVYKHFVRGIIDFNLPGLLASATGSTFPNVSRDQLEDLVILIPTPPEQKAIASVISSLDDKIDLLHRQNKTLEAMAETLFRQWFVEEAKEDWKEKPLAYIAEHKKINIRPNKNPATIYCHYSIPSFDEGKHPVKELGSEIMSNKYQVLPNSILISKLNPRFPRVWSIPADIEENSICSTEFQVVYPIQLKYCGFIYCLLKLKQVTDELIGAAGGTSGSHQRVKPEDIFNIVFKIPNSNTVDDFNKVTSEHWQRINNNMNQIRTLKKLRDTLLSKLMNGEVRVEYEN